MGKSTSAQLLARDAGYVYYEADCFTQLKNPYIPLDTDNPSMAQVRQKPLRGPGAAERKLLYSVANDCFGAIMAGQQHDKAAFLTVYEAMAEDIRRERARIGGDWAVANVVISREIRDRMRWAVLTRQLDPGPHVWLLQGDPWSPAGVHPPEHALRGQEEEDRGETQG